MSALEDKQKLREALSLLLHQLDLVDRCELCVPLGDGCCDVHTQQTENLRKRARELLVATRAS